MIIVITGINTDVGKTVTSSIVVEALKACYWKPIQCGLPKDSDWVDQMISKKGLCQPEKYCLTLPASPHLAAREEGLTLDSSDFTPPLCDAPLVVEGAGGLLAPINATESFVDAATRWNARWILVHRHYLGSLNHFLLTVEAMRARNLSILGVVFNGKADHETEEMLLKRSQLACIGRLEWQKEITQEFIKEQAKTWKPILKALL